MSIIGQPDPSVVPRYVGIGTFARLPYYECIDHKNIDIGIIEYRLTVDVFFVQEQDLERGTRRSSRLLRQYNPAQDKYPFKNKQVCDMRHIVSI